jgi:hypothetical protein
MDSDFDLGFLDCEDEELTSPIISPYSPLTPLVEAPAFPMSMPGFDPSVRGTPAVTIGMSPRPGPVTIFDVSRFLTESRGPGVSTDLPVPQIQPGCAKRGH